MPNWPFSKKAAPKERIEPTIGNAIPDGAIIPSSDGDRLYALLAGLNGTPSGAVVNEQTAMQVSAVYACVSRIAGAIASLPLTVYERDGAVRKQYEGHDVWWLLNEQPCASFTAATFWEFVTSQVLLRGDSIAYLYRGEARNSPEIKAIIPVPRSQVQIQRLKMPEGYRGPAKLVYTIHTGDGGYFTVDQGDVLHFPNLGFDGISSMSAIQYGARNAVGTAISADDFAGKFFSQGAQPQFAIKAPGEMTPDQQEAFRAAWVAKYAGNGPNGTPLILTEGLEVQELSMTAADAQLLESRKWQVIDIARAFGVPPFMIGETEKTTSWGAGIEQMGIGFVRYTLMPHLVRFQQELNRKIWPIRERFFVEFDVDGLLSGDATARANFYKSALGGTQAPGYLTVNEVRAKENLPPIQGGDQLYAPVPGDSANEPAPPQAAA